MPAYEKAVLAVWGIWGLSWLAAWGWSGRTEGSAGGSRQAPYRLLNIVGFGCLFADDFLARLAGVRTILRPVWHLPTVVGWAMAALALGSFLFAWSARVTLGRLWSAAVTRKAGHRLVETGPYKLVRHPIYTGLLSGAVALAMVKASPLALFGLALLIAGYTLKARLEERFLGAELGQADYAAYRARVPMLVPFLRG